METILILTSPAEQTQLDLEQQLRLTYPTARLLLRFVDDDLWRELDGLPHEQRPQLILMDPCIDCLPFLRELKFHPSFGRIPVLMLKTGVAS